MEYSFTHGFFDFFKAFAFPLNHMNEFLDMMGWLAAWLLCGIVIFGFFVTMRCFFKSWK
jgi:hypothetical protein